MCRPPPSKDRQDGPGLIGKTISGVGSFLARSPLVRLGLGRGSAAVQQDSSSGESDAPRDGFSSASEAEEDDRGDQVGFDDAPLVPVEANIPVRDATNLVAPVGGPASLPVLDVTTTLEDTVVVVAPMPDRQALDTNAALTGAEAPYPAEAAVLVADVAVPAPLPDGGGLDWFPKNPQNRGEPCPRCRVVAGIFYYHHPGHQKYATNRGCDLPMRFDNEL